MYPASHYTAHYQRAQWRALIMPGISTVIIAIMLSIGTAMFGDHPPEPNKCDPEFRHIVTPVTSPGDITLWCFDPGDGPKHSPR